MGRRKISIEPLLDERNRTVTFVKRKAGLFKKAHELAILCQVDLALIIVNSHTNTGSKIFEYSSVDTNLLLSYYQDSVEHGSVPREMEGPENYGDYKKQMFPRDLSTDHGLDAPQNHSHNHKILERRYDNSDKDSMGTDDAVDNYNSSTHQRNHSLKTETNPMFNIAHAMQNDNMAQTINSPALNHLLRPVLRVQIPKDSNNLSVPNADTTHTITVTARSELCLSSVLGNKEDDEKTHLDISSSRNHQAQLTHAISATSLSESSNHHNSSSHPYTNAATSIPYTNRTNSISYSNAANPVPYSSFLTQDHRRPKLPVPAGTSKSQVSSPIDLPLHGTNLQHWNPSNINVGSRNIGGPPLGSAAAHFYQLQLLSPSTSYPNGLIPTPVLNQVLSHYDQTTGTPAALYLPASSIMQGPGATNKHRPALFNNGGGTNTNDDPQQRRVNLSDENNKNSNLQQKSSEIGPEDQTPQLLIPMRYTQDLFPSPSIFYPPQDWPNGNTIMTPVCAPNILLYFMNITGTPTLGAWSAGGGVGQSNNAISNSRATRRPTKAEKVPSPIGIPPRLYNQAQQGLTKKRSDSHPITDPGSSINNEEARCMKRSNSIYSSLKQLEHPTSEKKQKV